MKKIKLLFCLLAFTTLTQGCDQEILSEPKEWEITQAQWLKDGLWYLQIKTKNLSGYTSSYLAIQILLKSGDTIKDDGLYIYTGDIIPNREYTFTFSQSGISATDTEYPEYRNYSVEVGEITVIYE